MPDATEAYAGCLSDHAVYPPFCWITLKMLLARTNCQGQTGLQLFAGSRISLWESIDAIPPSVSDAPGAPPFTLVWSMSMPSSYSVVVPVGAAPGVHGPAKRPLP